jgi:hypothetical protein
MCGAIYHVFCCVVVSIDGVVSFGSRGAVVCELNKIILLLEDKLETTLCSLFCSPKTISSLGW